MKLLLALPWYCPMLPDTQEDGKQEWTYRADFNPEDYAGGKEISPVFCLDDPRDVHFYGDFLANKFNYFVIFAEPCQGNNCRTKEEFEASEW